MVSWLARTNPDAPWSQWALNSVVPHFRTMHTELQQEKTRQLAVLRTQQLASNSGGSHAYAWHMHYVGRGSSGTKPTRGGTMYDGDSPALPTSGATIACVVHAHVFMHHTICCYMLVMLLHACV